jgi:hypothetical protein
VPASSNAISGSVQRLGGRLTALPGLALAAALVTVLIVPDGFLRDATSAAAILASAVWLLADGWRQARRYVSARLLLGAGLLVLVAVPAWLLTLDPSLWNGSPRPRLGSGLAIWAIGAAGLAYGAKLGHSARLPGRQESRAHEIPQAVVRQRDPRGRVAWVAVWAVAFGSFVAFLAAVGGPLHYLAHLDDTGTLTGGLTYLVWGLSFGRYAAFAMLGEAWACGRTSSRRELAVLATGMLLVAIVGSRLLLLAALVQLALLWLYFRPVMPRPRVTLLAALVAALVVVFGLGGLRRYQSLHATGSFPAFLANNEVPELPRVWVNQYADSVRLAVIAHQVVPAHAGFEYGKELLRVVLQPLPSGVRPHVAEAPALVSAFTSPSGGNALPLPVIGYIQFGFVGAFIFPLLLGAAAGALDRAWRRLRDVGAVLAAIAASTGVLIVLRGSLPQALAIALIDVLGLFAAHRLLYRRPTAADTPTSPSIGAR